MATISNLKAAISKAQREGKTRISDGHGLYALNVKGKGTWSWRCDYAVNSVRKTLSLGLVDDVTLTEARDACNIAKQKAKDGIDPSAERKEAKAQAKERVIVQRRVEKGLPLPGTLAELVPEWIEHKRDDWSPAYSAKVEAQLRANALGELGHLKPDEVNEALVYQVLKKVESRPARKTIKGEPVDMDRTTRVVARDVLQHLSLFYVWAVASGKAQRNPCGGMRKALKKKTPTKSYPALTDPHEFAKMLADLRDDRIGFETRHALLILAVTMVRPINVRSMEWAHISFERAEWRIPAELMKGDAERKQNGDDHVVHLPAPVLQWLREMQPLSGHTAFVFPNKRDGARFMSENTMGDALDRIGYENKHSPHGFRAAARTICREVLHVDKDVLEKALGHVLPDAVAKAYSREQWLVKRRELFDTWGRVVADAHAGRGFAAPKPTLMLTDLSGDDADKQLMALLKAVTGKKPTKAMIAAAKAALSKA